MFSSTLQARAARALSRLYRFRLGDVAAKLNIPIAAIVNFERGHALALNESQCASLFDFWCGQGFQFSNETRLPLVGITWRGRIYAEGPYGAITPDQFLAGLTFLGWDETEFRRRTRFGKVDLEIFRSGDWLMGQMFAQSLIARGCDFGVDLERPYAGSVHGEREIATFNPMAPIGRQAVKVVVA